MSHPSWKLQSWLLSDKEQVVGGSVSLETLSPGVYTESSTPLQKKHFRSSYVFFCLMSLFLDPVGNVPNSANDLESKLWKMDISNRCMWTTPGSWCYLDFIAWFSHDGPLVQVESCRLADCALTSRWLLDRTWLSLVNTWLFPSVWLSECSLWMCLLLIVQRFV